MLTRREMLAGCSVMAVAVLADPKTIKEDDMQGIETRSLHLCNTKYTTQQIHEAERVANRILHRMKGGGYKEGWRNNMAVDLSCAMYVLNLVPLIYAEKVLKGRDSAAYLDFCERYKTIKEYLDGWHDSGWTDDGVIAYMLDQDYWLNDAKAEDPEKPYIKVI